MVNWHSVSDWVGYHVYLWHGSFKSLRNDITHLNLVYLSYLSIDFLFRFARAI